MAALRAPAADAEALAACLRDPDLGGFRVREVNDQPSWVIAEEVERFFTERALNDVTLFYFTGHGIKDEDGGLYFAAMNTKRQLLRSTAVPSEHMIAAMRRCRSRQQVLLLDCCYAGAFSRALLTKGDERVDVQERFASEGMGRVVITASDAMQYAFEGEQLRGEAILSDFTRMLVEGIMTGGADDNNDGRISLEELYNYVYARVRQINPNQTPTSTTLERRGEIVVALNPRAAISEPRAAAGTADKFKHPRSTGTAPRGEGDESMAVPPSAAPNAEVTQVEPAVAFTVSEIVAVEHSGINVAAISPDGSYLATAGLNKATLWELPSGRQLLTLKDLGEHPAVAFSPDGRCLATTSAGRSTIVWELSTGRQVLALKRGGKRVEFSLDGKLLASCAVWEFPGGREVMRPKHCLALVFNRSGDLLAGSPGSNRACVWELPGGRELLSVKHGGFFSPIMQVGFSPDGRYLATASKSVRMWELPKGLDANTIGGDGIVSFAFSPDERFLVTTEHWDSAARVWLLSSNRVVERVPHPGIYQVTISPDGRSLVTAGGHRACVWTMSTRP